MFGLFSHMGSIFSKPRITRPTKDKAHFGVFPCDKTHDCIEKSVYPNSADYIYFHIGHNSPIERQTIYVCYDDDLSRTVYSSYEMFPPTQYLKKNLTVNFKEDNGNIGISELYNISSQKIVFDTLLGNEMVERYITDAQFLTRGHLAAVADFDNGNDQLVTVYYRNVVPQWSRFNNGGWQTVEQNVQALSESSSVLLIFCGCLGTLKLKNKSGRDTEIYLRSDSYNYRLPVPKLFFKVIYDPYRELGVVLVGVNNPYATLEEIKNRRNGYMIGDDVSNHIKWFTKNQDPNKLGDGFTYACSINDFLVHVPALQSQTLLANNKGLLTH